MNRAAKIIIKLLLIAGLVVFALWNYRLYSFNKGISKTKNENYSISQTLSMLVGIQKVEYYESTIKQDDYIYNVYIETSDNAYLLKATQDDIDSFSLIGIFSGNLKPIKISPIPFYVEIILGFIILIIPTASRKSNK